MKCHLQNILVSFVLVYLFLFLFKLLYYQPMNHEILFIKVCQQTNLIKNKNIETISCNQNYRALFTIYLFLNLKKCSETEFANTKSFVLRRRHYKKMKHLGKYLQRKRIGPPSLHLRFPPNFLELPIHAIISLHNKVDSLI